MGTLVLAVTAVMVGLSWGNKGATPATGLVAFGAAMAAVFVIIELKSDYPIMPLEVCRNRTVAVSLIVVLLSGFGLYGSLLFAPLFFQSTLGMSAAGSGTVLAPIVVGLVLGRVLPGTDHRQNYRLLPRPGSRRHGDTRNGNVPVFHLGKRQSRVAAGPARSHQERSSSTGGPGCRRRADSWTRGHRATRRCDGAQPVAALEAALSGAVRDVFIISAGLIALSLIAAVFLRVPSLQPWGNRVRVAERWARCRTDLGQDIHPARLAKFAREGTVAPIHLLSDFSKHRRIATLVAHLREGVASSDTSLSNNL